VKSFLLEAKFIIGFFVLLTAVTVFSNFDFENDEKPVKLSLNEFAKVTNSKQKSTERQPAAINAEESLTLNKQFFCKPTKISGQDKVSKRLIMLNFKICREMKAVQQLNIVNQSNGFKAQIFALESQSFKTDYIQLNEGVNKLKLEAVLKDGQKLVESLEILSGS
jgi:hypothetical protein